MSETWLPAWRRLIEGSLVSTVEGDGERRFRLLETVREYATARLDASVEAAEIQERHARFYQRQCAALNSQPWLQPLTPLFTASVHQDYANYLGAITWATRSGDHELALQLTQSLWVFWRVAGLAHIGLERFRALLDIGFPSPGYSAAAHAGVANFVQLLGQRTVAMEHAMAALETCREVGSRTGEILALGMLGEIAAESGRHDEARQHLGEAAALTATTQPGRWGTGVLLGIWGMAEYWAGDLERADELLSQSATVLAGFPETWHPGLVRIRQGSIARLRGDLEEATRLIREGLAIVQEFGAAQEVAHGCEEFAAVECAQSRYKRGATLLGAASQLREVAHTPVIPADASSVEETVTRVRNALGDGAFTAAWIHGRGLTRAAAVDYASGDPGPTPEPIRPLSALTSRELEVARLVSEGLSNSAIASRLVISEATARTHVERIRTKLGVRSRVNIARAL